jgi:hypothetical protein
MAKVPEVIANRIRGHLRVKCLKLLPARHTVFFILKCLKLSPQGYMIILVGKYLKFLLDFSDDTGLSLLAFAFIKNSVVN